MSAAIVGGLDPVRNRTKSGDKPRYMKCLRLRPGEVSEYARWREIAQEQRPTIRQECRPRWQPCPFIGCRHHLFLDILEDGRVRVNFPHLDPTEIPYACSLDVSEALELKEDIPGICRDNDDDMTIYAIMGVALNLTGERARQLTLEAMESFRKVWERLSEDEDDGSSVEAGVKEKAQAKAVEPEEDEPVLWWDRLGF